MLRVVNVKFMGSRARELLNQNTTGKIHSAFERVFNIKFDDTLVGVARKDVYRSQINLITDVSTEEKMDGLGIRRGMRTRVERSKIIVGNVLEVSVEGAEIWHSSKGVQNPPNPEVIKRNLEEVKQKFSYRDIDQGIGQLLPHLDDILKSDSLDTTNFNIVAKKALPLIVKLVQSSMEGSSEKLKAASKGLIGLGLGLTPSGDDTLSGFMISRWWIANSFETKLNQIEEENASIKEQIKDRTTLFSKQHLNYASKGRTNEAVESFLKTILENRMKNIDPHINRVMRMGETSGADMMMGLLLGLETALELLDNG